MHFPNILLASNLSFEQIIHVFLHLFDRMLDFTASLSFNFEYNALHILQKSNTNYRVCKLNLIVKHQSEIENLDIPLEDLQIEHHIFPFRRFDCGSKDLAAQHSNFKKYTTNNMPTYKYRIC